MNNYFNHFSNFGEVIREIVPLGTILDLGCGSGELLKNIKYYNKTNYSLIGLDVNKEVLSKVNDDDIRLINADATLIPLENKEVDLVIVSNLFHLINDQEKLIAEIKRILSDKGKFIYLSNSLDNEYLEFGENLKLYNEIKDMYIELYKKELRVFNAKQKVLSDDNIYKKINKHFIKTNSFKTNAYKFVGSRSLLEYLGDQEEKNDYFLSDIPMQIHQKIYINVENQLKKLFKLADFDLKISYKGTSSYIIDVYEKL